MMNFNRKFLESRFQFTILFPIIFLILIKSSNSFKVASKISGDEVLLQKKINSHPKDLSHKLIRTLIAIPLVILPIQISDSSIVFANEVQFVRQNPNQLLSIGMNEFKKGNIQNSVETFNTLVSENPEYEPFMWQRGISLFYSNKFVECGEQFRRDTLVNSQDSEESMWTVLCESKTRGFKKAQEDMPVLPMPDHRPVMQLAYQVFEGTASEKQLLDMGDINGKASSQFFYSRLYLSLYNEAKGEFQLANSYIKEALGSFYGTYSNDYMVAVAKAQNIHMDSMATN